ncbi:15729_t:CDS:2 [Gigaspora margarita]|uniref:15729_t:CDS:1 n=1 Tax=Gigaspora margarita TaxID=4874 RepID=A0ABM8W348_GIGMA|nr:15729_t:CDS:2 [Gigaspora margarita]
MDGFSGQFNSNETGDHEADDYETGNDENGNYETGVYEPGDYESGNYWTYTLSQASLHVDTQCGPSCSSLPDDLAQYVGTDNFPDHSLPYESNQAYLSEGMAHCVGMGNSSSLPYESNQAFLSEGMAHCVGMGNSSSVDTAKKLKSERNKRYRTKEKAKKEFLVSKVGTLEDENKRLLDEVEALKRENGALKNAVNYFTVKTRENEDKDKELEALRRENNLFKTFYLTTSNYVADFIKNLTG